MTTRRTVAVCAALAVRAGAVFGIEGALARDTIHEPDYVGETIAGRKTPVLIRVKTKHGERRYARFEAQDYWINCDDGTFDQLTLGPIKARFLTRRLFQYQSYITTGFGRFFFQVRGRIFPGLGVARGLSRRRPAPRPRRRARRRGEARHLLQRQLGHSSLATTSRYLDHIAPQELIAAMRAREWAAPVAKA